MEEEEGGQGAGGQRSGVISGPLAAGGVGLVGLWVSGSGRMWLDRKGGSTA